jgi:phage recombination protein Bet
MSEVRSIVRAPSVPFEFTEQQQKMILTSFLNGAPPAEATVLLELARIRRLNPITRQIHFVKRWDSQKKMEIWAAQVGIDGFRAIAERTGLYDGQDEPEFEYDDKKQLKLCRVKVWRKDWGRASVGVAHFSEYVQLTKEGGPNVMWRTKPHIMLAKCAEALAFRKAFPDDTSGLYAPEEIEEDPVERELNQLPQQAQVDKPTRTEAIKAKLAAKNQASNIEVHATAEPVPVAAPAQQKAADLSAMPTPELEKTIAATRDWLAKNPRSAKAPKGRERLTDMELEFADRQLALAREREIAAESAPVEEEAPFP